MRHPRLGFLVAAILVIFYISFAYSEDLFQPINYDALPKEFQVSDEMIDAKLAFYKKQQVTRPINVEKSARFDCVNCFMLVEGYLVVPPFYIEKTDDSVFINGHLIHPLLTYFDVHHVVPKPKPIVRHAEIQNAPADPALARAQLFPFINSDDCTIAQEALLEYIERLSVHAITIPDIESRRDYAVRELDRLAAHELRFSYFNFSAGPYRFGFDYIFCREHIGIWYELRDSISPAEAEQRLRIRKSIEAGEHTRLNTVYRLATQSVPLDNTVRIVYGPGATRLTGLPSLRILYDVLRADLDVRSKMYYMREHLGIHEMDSYVYLINKDEFLAAYRSCCEDK